MADPSLRTKESFYHNFRLLVRSADSSGSVRRKSRENRIRHDKALKGKERNAVCGTGQSKEQRRKGKSNTLQRISKRILRGTNDNCVAAQ